MRTISCCSGDSSPADAVAQQLGAFAHRGQRRLELMRDVAQKTVLLLLELVQARAQPFEPLPEVAHVLRAVDLDRVSKVRPPHLPDRLIELADRSRDQHGEDDRQRQRNRDGRERQVEPFLAALRRGLLQALDRALRQLVGRGEQRLRALNQLRVAVGQLCGRRRFCGAGEFCSWSCRRASASPSSSSVGDLVASSGSNESCRVVCAEVLAHPPVILEQRRILEDDLLPRPGVRALSPARRAVCWRDRLAPPAAPPLGPALPAIERKDELAQRVEQRQADEQEAEQDELEERARR